MNKQHSSPLFSVVMPVYNKEEFVERAIKSVLNQEFSNFELIVVCDPSTDNSYHKVAAFSDDRIRILQRDQPGPGGYAARNVGIKYSSAEWVCFLDADDEWLPNHLTSSKDIIKGCPEIEFISHNYTLINGSGPTEKIQKEGFSIDRAGKYTRDDVLEFLKRKDVFCTNGVVLKKNILIRSGMFPDGETKRAGDIELFLKSLFNTKCIYISDIPTSVYYLDASGVVKNVRSTGEIHPITETVKKMLASIRNKNTKKNLMLFSNRKAIAWSMQRKMGGIYQFSELRNIFFSQLSLSQWARVFFMLMPNELIIIYKKLVSRI